MPRLAERVLHLLLPRTCAHCLEDLPLADRGPLCAACLPKLKRIEPLFCLRCGLPIDGGAHCRRCRGRRFHCRRIRGAFVYGPELQSLVVKLKYGGRRGLAEPLGGWLAEALKELPRPAPDALVPVPLHPRRERRRGFNQARLLAEAAGRKAGLPVHQALEKTRSTRPQAELNGAARRGNLKGAYRTVENVKGLRVALVDDVGTTGSTLEECARELRRAGAAWVGAIVLARQPIKK